MRLISGIPDQWLGLCRKPPVAHALQTDSGALPAISFVGLPDGGSGGGSGTIRQGVMAAFSGMRTLNRNRQLLWFGLLAGLVLAGNAVSEGALRYINRTLQPDIIGLYIQEFFLWFATLFCLLILLAGLILSISSKKEGPVSIFEGLKRAKKYGEHLFLWSIILALAGILLFRIWVDFFIWLPPEFRFLQIFGPYNYVSSMITQFPFNWTLDWGMLTEVPGYGGRSLLLLIYPFGFMKTMKFLVISLLLFILTPFVVPLIVLEQKTVWTALGGSFALMKKTWTGIASCTCFLGIIISGVFLTYLLIQAASGMVDPYNTVLFHPPGMWIALAILYNLGLLIAALVAATIGGIAAHHIYLSAKSRYIDRSHEP